MTSVLIGWQISCGNYPKGCVCWIGGNKKYIYKSIVSVNSGGDKTDTIAKCILFVKADLQVPGNLMFCSPKVSGGSYEIKFTI